MIYKVSQADSSVRAADLPELDQKQMDDLIK